MRHFCVTAGQGSGSVLGSGLVDNTSGPGLLVTHEHRDCRAPRPVEGLSRRKEKSHGGRSLERRRCRGKPVNLFPATPRCG